MDYVNDLSIEIHYVTDLSVITHPDFIYSNRTVVANYYLETFNVVIVFMSVINRGKFN